MQIPKISETITLQDGSKLTIRPIQPSDAPLLQGLHSRLSDQSLEFRFHGHNKTLSDAQARFYSYVDYENTMGLVAILPESDGEHLVGVARYAIIPSRAQGQAEAAIVVEDKYQKLGLGIMLSDRLVAYAQKHGLHTFISFIDPENIGVMRLIKRCGLDYQVVSRDTDSLEIHIDITPKAK